MLTRPTYFSFTFKVRILWTKKTKGTGEEPASLPASSEAGQGVTQDGFWVV